MVRQLSLVPQGKGDKGLEDKFAAMSGVERVMFAYYAYQHPIEWSENLFIQPCGYYEDGYGMQEAHAFFLDSTEIVIMVRKWRRQELLVAGKGPRMLTLPGRVQVAFWAWLKKKGEHLDNSETPEIRHPTAVLRSLFEYFLSKLESKGVYLLLPILSALHEWTSISQLLKIFDLHRPFENLRYKGYILQKLPIKGGFNLMSNVAGKSASMKVAGIQLGPFLGSYEDQINKIIELSDKLLASERPDVLCLPELMTSPYVCTVELEGLKKYAEALPGPTTKKISELAKRYNTTIIGTLFEIDRDENKYYNTAFISTPDGNLLGNYRKTHIPYIDVPGTKGFEKFYFSPGSELNPYIINQRSTGILICYDRSFPEAWRVLTLKGAEIVFVLASSSGFRSEAFVDELKIRAMENGVFVFAVNKYGDEKMEEESEAKHFYGRSCVIDPFGNVIKLVEDEPNLGFTVEIPLEKVAQARERLAYLSDRRPELYSVIGEPVKVK
ncbi:MAG: carbon-nitrogen hydrolase family protein [Desulfitobacteriaceae bacterium]